MHTIKLQVEDSIYSHIMFFLQNLNTRELKIIESDINAFTDHSANLIEDWKDVAENEIWK